MTSQFFEGPAGTGKTWNLMRSLEGLVMSQPLQKHQKVLAVTFMHGSRSRLHGALSELPRLRRRFDCMTFDALAGHIASRWRDLLDVTGADTAIPETENEYDKTCYEAALLLGIATVQNWVKGTYPIVLVDEAQDLSPARLGMMQGLARGCVLLAAADEYQHLEDSHGNNAAIGWLSSNMNVTRLAQPRRTSDQGLIQVAHSLRNSEGIMPLLNNGSNGRKHLGSFSLIAVPSWQYMAWHIGHSLFSAQQGTHAILTLSAGDPNANNAINKVKTEVQNLNRSRGTTFGPFPDIYQERKTETEAQDCITSIGALDEAIPIDRALIHSAAIEDNHVRDAMQRWCRKYQRVLGYGSCEPDDFNAAIHEAFHNKKRYIRGADKRRQSMLIHQAKNREFDNVIVLWTYSLAGDASDEYKRRLLYNAITRAKRSCTVIVLGANRINSAPFSAVAPLALQIQR
ncbi:hypothetical protein ABF87_13455 [Nitrosomonas sp. JL21]|uniref:ATP-dependent helicase n=1 Tax=Nitrosomonas sp. JL21 TaxID=153949 RepID=UPI00136E4830|nr:ATP-dependent helicase [Nitrosomonas sp. JL21]MXS78943.1 hypothetical protein [Nitrosomonas sp. JL21]